MNQKIIVFTGSTLSAEEANQILPGVSCHLPVKCGDIFRVLRLLPKIIVIIDGLFEQNASVWHKEILYAMSRGVRVYGASSMGALRAAELNEYGMIGFGKIFTYYKDRTIVVDDDEVAITHTMNNKECNTNVIPLINMRFTLEKAIENRILDREKADSFLLKIKEIPYFQRNLKLIERKIADSDIFSWIKINYIDQKKLDAIQLLEHISKNKNCNNPSELRKFNSTFFIRKLYREIISSPFEMCYGWLTSEEKELCQYQGTHKIEHIKILSKLAHNMFDISCVNNISHNDHIKVDCNVLIEYARSMVNEKELKDIFKFYVSYSGLYVDYKENTSAWKEVKNIIYAISIFLTSIVFYIETKNIDISSQYQDDFFETMRRKIALLTGNDTRVWLKSNGVNTVTDYQKFILIGSIFYYVVVLNNVEFIGINTEMNLRPWLVETLSFSNEIHDSDFPVSDDLFIFD